MATGLSARSTVSSLPLSVRWLVLGLAAALLVGCTPRGGDPAAPSMQRVTLAGRTFHLEVAADDDARYQGLSDRPSIPEDGGMLFVFPDAAVRTFVMRRCLVPIDIAFLGPRGRIVAMHAMQVEPYDTPESRLTRYSSHWPAQFAIELRGGTLAELGVELGQAVELPLEALQAVAR